MGRKRIHKTKEQILKARRKWSIEYYYRNQEILKKKRMERYAKETNS
jgi:hypothetical protein